MLLLVQGQASAFVQSPNNMPDDAWRHFNGLEWGQIKRNWSSHGLNGDANPINPYCRVEVTEVYDVPASSGGNPRRAFRFKVIGNADGRAHAFEAGGYVDSTTDNCINEHNPNAWDGKEVDLDAGIFANPAGSNATRQRPINVTLGLTATQEAQAVPVRSINPNTPAFRQENTADWDAFDVDMKRQAGIKPTTQGGGYGYIADGGGYKVNDQIVWCAGIDIGNLSNITNDGIQWPGNFFGNCRWDHRFKSGTNSPGDGNFETNWGAYAIGAMGARTLDGNNNETSTSSPAIRCTSQPCPIGSSIPGLTRESDNTVSDFGLVLAGIKNHDGAGTFQGNPDFNGFSAPYNNIDWRARNLTGNPFKISFTEAWLTMEWDPAGGGPQPPQISCRLTFNPEVPEPGQSFDVELQFSYVGSPAQLRGRSQVISTGPIPGNPSLLQPSLVGPRAVPTQNQSWPIGTYTGPAGDYTYTAQVTVDGTDDGATCPGTLRIAAKPYFKVWTNDVQVGGNFANSSGVCNPALAVGQEDAAVIGYGGDGSSNTFRGSSTEFGLSTLGEIRNFFSASQRSPRNNTGTNQPTPPHGLTFANAQIGGISSGDPGDGNKVVNYGGVSEQASCAENWFDTNKLSDNRETLPANFFFTTAEGASGTEATIVPQNSTASIFRIQSAGNVSRPRAIFVEKNIPVVIRDNIVASPGQTLFIIANGDIRISREVTQIDAVLISRGSVVTCSESNGNLIPNTALYASCNSKLVIRGAVIANELKLRRTFGSRFESGQNEPSDSRNGNTKASEEILFDPTLYTTRTAIKASSNSNSQIDFITSLPPIL